MTRGGGVGHYGMESSRDTSRLRHAMARHVTSGSIPGLVTAVARGTDAQVDTLGDRAYPGTGAAGPMTRDTVFRIASLTKPMIATAVLQLVADGILELGAPVGDLLPELAARRVLTTPEGALSDTVPADREITLRDLLTFTWGFGIDPAMPPDSPVLRAAEELQLRLGPPVPPVDLEPDEWLRRLGTLPLLRQPGATWLYDVGSDVLGVLLARAGGADLATVLRQRVFEPLGMRETAFHATADQQERMPPLYGPDGGTPIVIDPADGAWSIPPAFPSGAGGLVSTVDDLLAFTGMLTSGGELLDPALFAAMTTDQLATSQRGSMILGDRGWGFGLSVYGDAGEIVGWAGGTGTYWFSDLRRGGTVLLLTQRLFGPASGALIGDVEQAMSLEA